MSNSKFYLLVAGSRTFVNYDLMVAKLDAFLSRQIVDHRSICIVSGGARGADKLAERYANARGFELRVFPADWDRFGKSAGYRRNEQMHQFIAQFEHRGCVCFWDGESRGTAHNFKLAEQFKTPLRIVRFKDSTLIYVVQIVSSGGVRYDYAVFNTQDEASWFCERQHWVHLDHNKFEWDLEIVERLASEYQTPASK